MGRTRELSIRAMIVGQRRREVVAHMGRPSWILLLNFGEQPSITMDAENGTCKETRERLP